MIHALELAKLIPGESILFMGAGVIGLLGIQTAKSYGATKIICADLDDSHLSKGMELGADLAVDVKTQDLKKVVVDATDGIGARVIVDTAGRPPEESFGIRYEGHFR